MRTRALPLVLFGLVFAMGCGTNEISGPTAPAGPTSESEFPVNTEFPGLETQVAEKQDPSGDLVDTAIAAGFKTLVAAVQAAGLEDALRSEGPFTVFAPTEAAFSRLPDGLVAQLLMPENQAKLQQLLKYHVVSGRVTRGDLRFFQRVETLEGSDLEIRRFFRLILVNHQRVKLADVMATNGVIHVIDEVLVPAGFSLEDPVAPTLDLVDTASSAGLTTLVTAAGAAGLEDALRDNGSLTVFAPTNEAFDRLPDGLVAELLLPENVELLQDLLLYHVTSGDVRSTDLRRFQLVEMLQGSRTLVIKTRGGRVHVNRSRVIAADVLATNGVAHVIDRVLIPRSFYGVLKSLPNEPPDSERVQVDL